MFSFASKMLNTLMGEGEEQAETQGGPHRQYYQPGPRLQQMSYPRHPSPQPIIRGGPEEPNLDLSHLSAEERALIQNVMAKAKDLDTTQVPVKTDNQYQSIQSKLEENRQNSYMSTGNYVSSHNPSSFRQDNFNPLPTNVQRQQESLHHGSMMFQNNLDHFNQKKENTPYSPNTPLDSYQNNSENHSVSSDSIQRYDNYQMKQEIQKLQDDLASSQRKEFSLQRQESYNGTKPQQSSYYENPCWENSKSDEVPETEEIQEEDVEYTSPVSNSPEIRLSPSSPPASPTSEDPRTSLLATSKDEIKPQLPMESFYDHSPGEVYTIPEEEDEISSPTSDGVTSLRKRRLVGGNEFQKTNENNPNSLPSNIRRNDYMTENRRAPEIGERTFHTQYLDKLPDKNTQPTSNLPQHFSSSSIPNKLEMTEKPFQNAPFNQYSSHQLRTQAQDSATLRGGEIRVQEMHDTHLQQQQGHLMQQQPHQQTQGHTMQLQSHPQTQSHLMQQQSHQPIPGQLMHQQSQLMTQNQMMNPQLQQSNLMQQQQQKQNTLLQQQNSMMQQQQQNSLMQQQNSLMQQNQQQNSVIQQQQPLQQNNLLQQQQPQQSSLVPQHQQQNSPMQQQQQPNSLMQQQQPNSLMQQQQPNSLMQQQQQNSLLQHQQHNNLRQHQQDSNQQQQIQPQQQQHLQHHSPFMQQQHSQSQNPQQQQSKQLHQNQPFNMQQGVQYPLPVNQSNHKIHSGLELSQPLDQAENKIQQGPQQHLSQLQQQTPSQTNLQQQMHRQQQQELQYLQFKKLQYLQRQQLHSRANSRTPLLPQNKQNMDDNFQMMKSEAGFYGHDESWRRYSEYPDDIGLQQFCGKDIEFDQKTRQHERAFGYQDDMEADNISLQKLNSQQSNAHGKSSAGTISGMLADFSRALGLSNSGEEKIQDEPSSHSIDNKDTNSSHQKPILPQQIHAQIRANEQFIQGHQSQSPNEYQSSQMSLESKQMRNQTDSEMQKNVSNNFQSAQYQVSQGDRQMDYTQFQQPNQQIQAYNQQVLHSQQNLCKDDFLNSMDNEQKAMYIQQQLYQKLPENQPFFAQNLTPQQQQMYQQHMMLQHHAQHLKKIKRSLPQSALEQQRQIQLQKKENNLNLLNQGLGGGMSVQQMVGGQLLGQQPIHPIQLMNSQIVGSDMKISSQSRIVTSSNPILVASGLSTQQYNSTTPLGTPQSTPVGTPRGARDGGDSSDTMSETDSQKSLRTRRKLPSIPSDQEAIAMPNSKKRDGRVKAKSPHDKFSRSYSPLRFPEGGYRISSSTLMLQRPSSSETNLRKISNFGPETIPRPGSALGLLQGSSVVSSSGLHSDYNRDSELASCLPPDLRYLLHSYKSSDPYSKQQFLQAYKDHVSGDRRALSRLPNLDWETERILSRNKEFLRNPKSRLDIQRKIAYSGIGRTRKMRSHRRQLSDPKIQLEMGSLKDDSDPSYDRGYYGIAHPSLRPPYKSYEYESIDDNKLTEWDSSHPYLTSYAIAGGALRETAINSVLDKEHLSSDPMRYDMRRYSDSLDLRRRDVGKHHNKPRSWQPSPYGSDEEEDQLSREQKKAKIKAEIARRRQQIEENARLHEELLRLARLRESAELGYAPLGNVQSLTGDYAMSSVLKSIDDLIGREAEYRTPEDRSMDRIASTFRTDDYTSGVYERLTDFSPITDFSTPHAMPLLPDMPTRSRKLLEDLGSSPITDSVLSLPQKAKALL